MTRKSLASENRGWGTILRHRWPTLVGIAAGTLALVDDGVDGSRVTTQLAVITLIVAVAYLPIGALRSQLGDPRVLVLETAGMLVFGALALGALLAEGGPPSTSWRQPGSGTACGMSPTTWPIGLYRGGTRRYVRSWTYLWR